MTKKIKNIDELFRTIASKAEKSPPPYVWDRIDNSLNMVSFRKKRRIIWLSAASFALMIAFGTGYFLALKNTPVSRETLSEIPNSITQNKTQSPATVQEPINNIVAETDMHRHFPDRNKEKEKIAIIETNQQIMPFTPAHTNVTPTQEMMKSESSEENTAENRSEQPALAQNINIITDTPLVQPENFKEIFTPESNKNSKGKIQITVYGATAYTYRILMDNGSNLHDLFKQAEYSKAALSSNSDKNYYNTIESPILTLSGGLNISYPINPRLTFSGGIYLGQYGHSNQEIFIYEDASFFGNEIINSSAGDIHISSEYLNYRDHLTEPAYLVEEDDYGTSIYLSPSKLDIQLSYLELPLSLRYNIFRKSEIIYFNFGLAPAVLSKNQVLATMEGRKIIGRTRNLRTLNVTGFSGIGISWGILQNNKLKINFEPQFRYLLNPISNLDYIRSHPFAVILVSGLTYDF